MFSRPPTASVHPEYLGQVRRDWHRLDWTDVGATRVPEWNPDPREHQGSENARELTHNLAPVTSPPTDPQHGEMRADVMPRVSLSKDVGAFQVNECAIHVASAFRRGGGCHFQIECSAQLLIHDSVTCRWFVGIKAGRSCGLRSK